MVCSFKESIFFNTLWFKNGEACQTVALYLMRNKCAPVWFWQTPSTQSQPETPLQSELLPELTGSAQSPPAEHIVTPPSTVDTAALSEEPLPGEEGRGSLNCFTTGSSGFKLNCVCCTLFCFVEITSIYLTKVSDRNQSDNVYCISSDILLIKHFWWGFFKDVIWPL